MQSATLLGGSRDLVSEVISTLIGVISIVTLIITPVTKSHDLLSIPTDVAVVRIELIGIMGGSQI